MAKKTLYIYNPVSIQSLVANGFIGSAGSILTSNGSAVYWNDDPGFTGSRGFTGSQGVIGYTGSKGDIGYTGSKGDKGDFGGAAFDYNFNTSTSASDPGSGNVAFSNTTLSSATTLYINQLDLVGANSYNYLQVIDDSTSAIKGTFRVFEKANTLNSADFSITGTHTHGGSYFSVPIAWLNGTTSFTDGLDVTITFVRTGDKGDTGYTGSIGYTGSAGADGYTGSAGTNGYTGSAGTNGYTGSAGTNGYTGSAGTNGYTGSAGTNGYTGSVGFTGSAGTTGFTGSTGFVGSQGYRGGLVYQFSQEVLDADPGAGIIRFSSATISSVTSLYIDLVDQYGYTLTNFINSWDDSTNTIKGQVILQPAFSTSGNGIVFNINGAVTTATGYRKVAVAYVTGTLPTDGDLLSIQFVRSGDLGYTGSNGFTGSAGFTGSVGFTGSAGTTGFTGSQGSTGFTGSGYGTSASVQMGSLGVGTPASGTTGQIRATNDITAYYTSDRNLKTNITTIENALEKLRQLSGVMFDWTDEYIESHGGEDGYFIRRRDTGIIAQDVQRVLPEVVGQRADGSLAVKYEKMMGLVIQAINELAAQVDEIQQKVS